MKISSLAFLAASLLALEVVPTEALADGPFTPVQLARRGKASLVMTVADQKPLFPCSGFVVHPDGLILTSAYVTGDIRGGAYTVNAVLHPGTDREEKVGAEVVRIDKSLHLALIRVDRKGLPALEFGDSDSVEELTELVGVGMLAGNLNPVGTKTTPDIYTYRTDVAALRRRKGPVEFLLERPVNSGCTGGPLLGENGKVLAVLPGSPTEGGVIHAMPGNRVKAFLSAPQISIVKTTLTRDSLGKPLEIRANAISAIPGGPKPTMELSLQAPGLPERKAEMTLVDGVYQAALSPLPPDHLVTVEAKVKLGSATISGPVPDRELTVGKQKLKLSDIRLLAPSKEPRAELHDGQTITGVVQGLDGVEMTLPGTNVRVPLAKADAIELTAPPRISSIRCVVVAHLGKEEVGRAETSFLVTDARESPPTVAKERPIDRPEFPPAKLEADRVVRPLPEKFTWVAAGGGGRYLFFLLPKSSRIAMFDVSQTRIVHYFPAPDADAKFAAGRDKLIIGLPGQGVLVRWNLKTLERELAVNISLQEQIKSLTMGSDSEGPFLVNGTFFDPATLQPIDVKRQDKDRSQQHMATGLRTLMSSDGSTVGAWRTGVTPSGLRVLTLTPEGVKSAYAHESPTYIAPGPDGQRIYTSNAVYTPALKKLHESSANPMAFVPAVEGPLYLGYEHGREKLKAGLFNTALFVSGDTRPLLRLSGFDLDAELNTRALGLPLRLWLIPRAQVLIYLPVGNDVIEIHRFDLDRKLEKAEFDYLVVLSDPHAVVRRGEKYTHRLDIRSKRGDVMVNLDAGPAGMTVSKEGVIEWTVPADYAEGYATGIASVADASGQRLFKSFRIEVRK